MSRVFYFDFGVRLFTLVKVVLQRLNHCSIENIFFSLNIFFFNITKVKVKYFHSIKVNSLRSFKVKQLFCCFFFFFFISFYLYSWLLMSFNIRTYFLNSLTSSSDTETPSTSGSRNTDKNILRYTV